MLYNYGSSILRAAGDTRRPLIYMILSGTVKVTVNLIFVRFFRMDVAGLAAATTIANIISATLVIYALTDARDATRLNMKKIRFHAKSFIEILKIGIPAGIQGSLFALSNVIVQSTINSFGSEAMAGSAATGSLESIVYVGFNAYYFSTISFVGQNHGAKKFKRIVKSFFYCLILSVVTATVLGWSIFLSGNTLLRIYNPNPEVIKWGMLRLKYLVTTYMLCAVMDVISGGLRGLGHSLTPMLVTLMGACVFRVVWVFWIFPLDPTMENLLISYPVSWILVSLVNGIILYTVVRHLFRDAARMHHGYGTLPARGMHPGT